MAVTYAPIATQSLGGATTYTFNSIPQTYTDLVVVFYGQSVSANGSYVMLRFNGDTTTNCYQTSMEAISSGPLSENTASTYFVLPWHGASFGTTTQWSTYVGHINAYSKTNNKKTLIGIWSGLTEMDYAHGVWPQTSAITSLTVFNPQGYAFASGSYFTIYGILAA